MKSITGDGRSDESSEDIHSEDNSPEEDCKNDSLDEFMIPMSYEHEKVTLEKHNKRRTGKMAVIGWKASEYN